MNTISALNGRLRERCKHIQPGMPYREGGNLMLIAPAPLAQEGLPHVIELQLCRTCWDRALGFAEEVLYAQ